MSDSDDTDILLLIPPNYYLKNAEHQLLHDDFQILQRQYTSLQELHLLERQYRQTLTKRDLTREFQAMDLAACKNDVLLMPPPTEHTTTESYKYLPPARKTELDHINARLHFIASEDIANIDNPSDISSISANTVRTQFGPIKAKRDPVGMAHSTPKYLNSSFKEQPLAKKLNNRDEDGVFIEIDNFLFKDDSKKSLNYWCQRHSDDYRLEHQLQQNAFSDVNENRQTQANSLPSSINTFPPENIQQSSCYQMSKAENNLISLSEIWGKSGQATAIATSLQPSLKEEQLRRQHLEQTVKQLQARLLEYQQRLSVAIEVDRTKDNALSNAQLENKSLNQELQQLRKNLQEYENQRKQYDDKLETLEKELSKAVSLASKFQDKNEKLEQEATNCSRKINETNKKLEEFEINVHACKRSEELALNELHKLRDKYAKSEHLYEKTKLRCEEIEKENTTLRHQKDMLQEYQQKQKTRADNLETQRKSMQESLAYLTENENALKKKLEVQQKTLKSHYQQQLENVVAQKLREFQEQLDKTEENLKSEARERERLIAERAVKQLELINEKNELELNLLQEKHNEEVELYRIQLANASKKIDDMEMKLNVYKSKRADIAEKLHNVMETQWQKALEILTSPHNVSRTTHNDTDHESASPDTNETHNNAIYQKHVHEQHDFETPKSSKRENNLNLLHKQEKSPMDKLQAYIELLLSKSPTDFNKLDEILALSAKAKESRDKLEKSTKRHCHSKPPWKS